MTVQEQIQIVEGNLNEYGQCNITLEEYNYIKDDLYSSGCLAGIELGRAEAIEECINIALDLPSKYIDYFDYVPLALLHKQLEQLKEQK